MIGGVVVLAAIICFLSGAVAISLFGRARTAEGRARAILFGSLFGALALWTASGRNSLGRAVLATVLLTLHCLASFHRDGCGDADAGSDAGVRGPADPFTLSLLTAGSAMVILGISLSAASIDRHAKGEVRERRILLDSALVGWGTCNAG